MHSVYNNGAGAGRLALNLLRDFTIIKITSAIIKKLMHTVRKLPQASTLPFSLAAASDKEGLASLAAVTSSDNEMYEFTNPFGPIINPAIGIIISETRESTIFAKATPIITPTARSITFPFKANSLNSEEKLIVCSFGSVIIAKK